MQDPTSQRADLEQGLESLLSRFSVTEVIAALGAVCKRKAERSKGDTRLFWVCRWAALKCIHIPALDIVTDLWSAEQIRDKD